MEKEVLFLLIVVGVGFLLLWQITKRIPVAGVVIGILVAGYGIWKVVVRDSIRRPYFDSVKKEFARFQTDPKAYPLDRTWHSYRIMKSDEWVDVNKSLLLPGDYFWVVSYDELFWSAKSHEDSISTRNVVFIQFRVTDRTDLFLGTSAVGKDTMYEGRKDNVFVKVWRKQRTLTKLRKAELPLWLMPAGLSIVLGLIGFLRKSKPRVIDKGMMSVEVLDEAAARRFFRSPKSGGSSVISEMTGTQDFQSLIAILFRFQGDPKGLADFIVRRIKGIADRIEAESYAKKILKATKLLNMQKDFNNAMVEVQKSQKEIYRTFGFTDLDKEIVKEQKQGELEKAKANTVVEQVRRRKAEHELENLDKPKTQSEEEIEKKRVASCKSVLQRYLFRLREAEAVLLETHYAELLKIPKLKALYEAFYTNTRIIQSLERHIEEDGVEPLVLEDEIREILKSVERGGDSQKSPFYKQGYNEGQKYADRHRGERNQVLNEMNRLRDECEERKQEINAKVQRGEVSQEEGEKRKKEVDQLYNGWIMGLKIAIS